ncbi:PadR family transcriptional regulator [uncultured Streptomyces sp.]|uniref:PadR family transcriptional regulator n=1 Tax=uncultured Streptomyces sp. TaxID=174707 RepID=UPI002637B7F9|nr:PadR family transcriptional regulator [uncultured Streptomyces sp.]
MPPVFAHGRLRLYLLKLLDEAPRHGYEVIRLLEERFQGLYAPSAGTVYPRLAKLEAEGLVTHATEGGRKVYSLTEAGRAELAGRAGELADLEQEIRESVSELAAEIRDDVRGAAGRLRSDLRAAASASRQNARQDTGRSQGDWESFLGDLRDLGGVGDKLGSLGDLSEKDAWRTAKEELRKAKSQWKEQARKSAEEARRAREDATRAREQARAADEKARAQMRDAARQVQDYFTRADWPAGVRESLADLTGRLGGFAATGTWPAGAERPEKETAAGTDPFTKAGDSGTAAGPAEDWAHDVPRTGDPARDLDRLLDRFRDEIRDAARDRGVDEERLAEAHRHLATAAARIETLLRAETGPADAS